MRKTDVTEYVITSDKFNEEFEGYKFALLTDLHANGYGIDLHYVNKIIKDHKGRIWAESVEGEGTTMHINLLKYKEERLYCLEDKMKDKKPEKKTDRFKKNKKTDVR